MYDFGSCGATSCGPDGCISARPQCDAQFHVEQPHWGSEGGLGGMIGTDNVCVDDCPWTVSSGFAYNYAVFVAWLRSTVVHGHYHHLAACQVTSSSVSLRVGSPQLLCSRGPCLLDGTRWLKRETRRELNARVAACMHNHKAYARDLPACIHFRLDMFLPSLPLQCHHCYGCLSQPLHAFFTHFYSNAMLFATMIVLLCSKSFSTDDDVSESNCSC